LLYPNMTFGSLHLIGNHDDTKVRVYSLPDRTLLAGFTVNPMERQVVQLPNGSFFKVVNDKPVTAMLIGGSWENTTIDMPGASTFHPSVDGGYVGKDFIFTTVEVFTEELNVPERVYALEDADVKVLDANGSTVKGFKLEANQAESFLLRSFDVYRVTSTGYIMVQTFNAGNGFGSILYYPAVEGGFIGTKFYGATHLGKHTRHERFYTFMAAEDSKVAVFDLDDARKAGDVTVSARNVTYIATKEFEYSNLGFESDKPMTMMFQSRDGKLSILAAGDPTVEGGVAYAGLKAGQTGYFRVPDLRAEGYIFAYQETVLDVDDVRLRVPADGYVTLTSGLHKITADQNVLIEVIQLTTQSNGQLNFAASIPSVQSMSLTYPDLRLKPLTAEELPLTYIAAGVAVAVILVVSAVALRRRARPG